MKPLVHFKIQICMGNKTMSRSFFFISHPLHVLDLGHSFITSNFLIFKICKSETDSFLFGWLCFVNTKSFHLWNYDLVIQK